MVFRLPLTALPNRICMEPSVAKFRFEVAWIAMKNSCIGKDKIPSSNNEFSKMDLKKMKNEDKLELCRKYYLGGFGLLPFLWFVNSVWFFCEAFRRPEYEQQKQIRTYVIRSIIGTLFWVTAITTWVVIFQLNRAQWGAVADYMSFIIPKGIP